MHKERDSDISEEENLSLSLLQKQFICLRLRSMYDIRTFEAIYRRGETIKLRLQIESAPNRLLRIFRQAYDSPYAKNCIHWRSIDVHT